MSIFTTNPIESAFSTVRNRIKLMCDAMNECLAMVFQLGIEAQNRWRGTNSYS